MTFTRNFRLALQLFKLDEKAMQELSKQKDAGWWGLLFITIAGFCFGISTLIVKPKAGIAVLLGGPVLMIITTFIGIGILFYLARLIGGKGTFHNYYRAYSHMYVLNWIAIIPFVGPFLSSLLGVWQVIIAIYVTKAALHLKLGKAAAVVLVPIVIAILVAFAATVAGMLLFLKYFVTVVQPTA